MEQTLINEFEEFSIKLSGPVLQKCVALCTEYNLSGEEFRNQWIAFASDSEPTEKDVMLLERKVLAPSLKKVAVTTPARKTPKVYQTSPKLSEDVTADYLQKNGTQTPKTHKKRPLRENFAEDDDFKRIQVDITNSPRNSFVSSQFTKDLNESSTRYLERVGAGEVLESFGNSERLARMTWRGKTNNILVEQKKVPDKYLYMVDPLGDRKNAETKRIETLAKAIIMMNDLSEIPVAQQKKVQNRSLFYGRVCEISGQHGDQILFFIENVTVGSEGETVAVKVPNQKPFSFYTGQIVVIVGANPTGETIFAQDVYVDGHAPFPTTHLKGSTPLQMVIACGPFTLNDDLAYNPLTDFIDHVTRLKPDVVILIGPFVDEAHPVIASGMLAETYQKHFQRLIDKVMEPLANGNTQVLLIPSFRDVHTEPVYPTPPYKLEKHYPNLHLCLDPAIIRINGILVAVTSLDVLRHITEKSYNLIPGDRMARLAGHILKQRSILPAITNQIPLDGTLFYENGGIFEETPHLLIVPSKMKYFIQDVNGCLVVNPENLGKGVKGGTFGRLEISPMKEPGSIINSVVCEILKI